MTVSKGFYEFRHEQARRRAAEHCFEAPDGWVCRIVPPNKSRDQEAKYHAMFGDIADQVEHCGQKFDDETWKRLLVDSFHHETKDDPDLAEDWRKVSGDMQFVPTLNRPGVIVLGQQTRHFTRKLASAFIEWLYVFGAENNVEWKAHYRMPA